MPNPVFPNLKYTSGDFSLPVAITAPMFSKPFSDSGINIDYVLTQDFQMSLIDYVTNGPLALDTPHDNYVDFLLTKEGNIMDIGGGKVKWTRTYAKLPATFSVAGGTYPYTFPAFNTGALITGRPPITLTVISRIQRDFFHQADSTTIPIIQPQRYVLTTFPTYDAISSLFGQPVVQDDTVFSPLTVPSLTDYQAMIAAGDEIVPEASRITANWNGNFHMRETIYLKAQ